MQVPKLKKDILDKLAKLNILNDRILSKIQKLKKRNQLNEFYHEICERKKMLNKFNQIANIYKVGSKNYFEYLQKNIDNKIEIYKYLIVVQIVVRGIKERERKSLIKKNKFEQRKASCLSKLTNDERISKSALAKLNLCKNFPELNAFLDSIPPIVLIELKIQKSKHGLDHLTKKSVYKVISTGQTN